MNNCTGFLLPHPPVIVPEVGQGREKEAKSTVKAMKEIAEQIKDLRPDTVVIISPHAPLYSDYVFVYNSSRLSGNFKRFGAELLLSFKQDSGLREAIVNLLNDNEIAAGNLDIAGNGNILDHGVMVPLYYLSLFYRDFELVAMSCSAMETDKLYKIGQLIKKAADSQNKKVVFIASGDLSHKVNKESPYGVCPEGSRFDNLLVDLLSCQNLEGIMPIDKDLVEKSAQCGYNSLAILCGIFAGLRPKIKVYSYEAPFGIGYCVASFVREGSENSTPDFEDKQGAQNESIFVKIARQTLESYVRHGKRPDLDSFPGVDKELLQKRAGVFVSIKKFGQLRGCIGTIAPTTQSIVQEIIQNAISAGIHDPRFEPVREHELEHLRYSVDVLGQMQPVKSKQELDPKKYGVVVEKGARRGLLLPDLEGVDTVDAQLEIALSKAGISPDEDYKIYKFTVTRYE